jgi:uncharacterized protein (DUF2252 family)
MENRIRSSARSAAEARGEARVTKKESTSTLLNDWQDFLAKPTTRAERIAQGKKFRDSVPRKAHAKLQKHERRVDPIKLLQSQDANRVAHLVPFRYGRMMQSPFAFYRGAAIVMASDLSRVPRTELNVQLCGDCHLSNFGIFATPERNVIFDLNDFDETLPGPFEWDVKRLAASFAVAAENNACRSSVGERCVAALAKTYRKKLEEFSEMSTLEVWYHRVHWEYLIERIKQPGRKKAAHSNLETLEKKRSHAGALAKLTEVVDGQRRIKDNPPFLFHSPEVSVDVVKDVFRMYANSLWQSRRRLLERYRFVDIAAKIVGVGSVGTVAAVALLQGEGSDDDLIFLQAKQAMQSVLEPYLGKSQFQHPGERIVNGQRLLQAASDMFLGWTSGPQRHFYVRQLMDMKASVPIEELDATTLEQYAEVCGYALARAHARTGCAGKLYGYLGNGDEFDEALVEFSSRYKKQNDEDYEALLKAIKRKTVVAKTAFT